MSILYNMESDTATDWSSSARKGSLETSMPRKFRKDSFRTKGATLNWAMCALCITSLAVSGLLMYRELGLESRIANLEARCQIQETPDILVQRLKREVQQELKVHRSASESNVFRIKRDVSECNCPQGESLVYFPIYLSPILSLSLSSRSAISRPVSFRFVRYFHRNGTPRLSTISGIHLSSPRASFHGLPHEKQARVVRYKARALAAIPGSRSIVITCTYVHAARLCTHVRAMCSRRMAREESIKRV